MENETEMLDSSNEQELESVVEDETEVQSDSDTQTEEVDVEALKQKNRELFARAKRAEGFELKEGKWVKKEKPVAQTQEAPKKDKDLSSDDLYALMDAKVPREYVDDVKKAAAVLNLPIADALNTSLVKTLLKTKSEEQATANATATKSTRPSNKVNSDDVILESFQKGEVSDKQEDIDRLVQAQLNKRIADAKKK